MTKIVWNGCDSYIESECAIARGYAFDGARLYHGAHEFIEFEAVEVAVADLPRDDDGEPDFDGIFGTETGKFYK